MKPIHSMPRGALAALGLLLVSGGVVAAIARSPDGTDRPSADPAGAFHIGAQLGGEVGALTAAGTTVYAGVGPRLVVLDASGDGAPRPVGQTPPLDGLVRAIAVADGRAYVGYGGPYVTDPAGLAVVDLGAAGAPRILGQIAITGEPVAVMVNAAAVVVAVRRVLNDGAPIPTASPARMKAEGRQAPSAIRYLGGDVLRIDVGDPASPRPAGKLELPELPVAMDGEASQLVLLASDESTGGGGPVLLAVDAAGQPSPRIVSRLAIAASTFGRWAMDVAGGYAAIGLDDWDGAHIVRVADPQAMRPVGQAPVGGSRLLWVDDRLYAAATPGGLHVLDVSDPTRPKPVGHVNAEVHRLAAFAGGLIGATNHPDEAGITVFGLDADRLPVARGHWPILMGATSVAARGRQLYATVGANLLATIDAADPLAPRQSDWARWSANWSWITTRMAAGQALGMIPAGGNGSDLHVAGLDDAGPPRLGPPLDIDGAATVGVAADGPLLVVASTVAWHTGTGSQSLHVVDASDPEHPNRVGQAEIPDTPVGVGLAGRTAYVLTLSNLHVFDLTQPDRPRRTATIPGVTGVGGYEEQPVAVQGAHLLVGTSAGLRLYDIAAPLAPRELGRWPAEGIQQVALAAPWLYATTASSGGRRGLLAFDMAAPGTGPAARFVPPSQVVSLTTQGGAAVISVGGLATDGGDGGLYWLRPANGDPGGPTGEPPRGTGGRTLWLPFVARATPAAPARVAARPCSRPIVTNRSSPESCLSPATVMVSPSKTCGMSAKSMPCCCGSDCRLASSPSTRMANL
jgi:hypothetical protein